MYKGAFTALVTPFNDKGVDSAALERLIDAQLAAGIAGLVPCGTTGETPTLNEEEREQVIAVTVKRVTAKRGAGDGAAKNCAVIAGTGSNSTHHTIATTRRAKALGADAALVVAPYYNKPTQEGLYQHFAAIAAQGGLPIVIYNIPGRTGCDVLADTVVRLQALPGVVGIKESTGSCDRVSELRERCRADFSILSGDDSMGVPMIAVGADGLVSVASNVVPERIVAMVNAALKGDAATARGHHLALRKLFVALFVESNPSPVKAALADLGRMQANVRLPLVAANEKTRALLKDALSGL